MTHDEFTPDNYEESYYAAEEGIGEDDYGREEQAEEIIEEKGLGFTDGFQFGCGFWAAAAVAAVIGGLLFLVASFLLSSLGINLLG
ncbi:MAG: hypothetical protein D6791_09470 [Chloroflexi bacterium]|nr:MAG: hypothetical protein D6791_09470 [Chloroflexota bacterium]